MPSKKCSCGKTPSYNIPGQTQRVFCSKCKTDDMVIVINRTYCLCGKRPNFNVPGETKGICCKCCKTDGMVNVIDKKCTCGKTPLYNIPGQLVGVYCKGCKTDSMMGVVSKKCLCGNLPVYNMPEEKRPVCCMKCKTYEMINVVGKRCRCGKQPLFNVPGQTKGVFCIKCKTDDMIDVKNKICPGYTAECPVRTRIGHGHEYCMSCDPNDTRRKLFKRYEEAFFEYVKDKLDVRQREFRVMFDPDETAKKFARLDGIVIDDGVIVCLEVDENGHQDYECEEHRMHLVTAELLKSYPEHVVSWVRVNPTTNEKTQWSNTSKKIREKLFEDAVNSVKDILKTRDTCVKYIGTYDM